MFGSAWFNGAWFASDWFGAGGTDLSTGIADTVEHMLEYALHGEQYLDVVATMSAGGTATLSYVDIFIVPR